MIASMIRSQSFSASNVVAPVRFRAWHRAPPRSPSLSRRRRRETFDPADALVQRAVVDFADDRLVAGRRATCAMPDPINPHPNTPTVLIAMVLYGIKTLSRNQEDVVES